MVRWYCQGGGRGSFFLYLEVLFYVDPLTFMYNLDKKRDFRMYCVFVKKKKSFLIHPSLKYSTYGMSQVWTSEVWIMFTWSIKKIAFFHCCTWLSPIAAGVGWLSCIVAWALFFLHCYFVLFLVSLFLV